MAESERGNKEPLDEGERHWKSGLETQFSKTKIMESGPIISWQMERGKVEAVTGLIFLGSKITAVSDFSHEIKGHLLLGRKAMTNLNSALKSRDITLLTKVCRVKTMFFQQWCTDVWVRSLRRLSAKELMLSNCGARDEPWESLGQQGEQTRQS